MLTRLAALARPLDIDPQRALGLAIYADHTGEHFGARESGIEGVACLDDAARALVLWTDLWSRTKLPVAREWVDGLLGFCRWMQQDDGRFVNFVLDWSGVRNTDGITSRADGASFWQARGARAMAKAWRVLGDERARDDYRRARASFDERPVGSDARAVQVLAALDAEDAPADIGRWCDDIVSQRSGDVLLDAHDATEPHVWAHIQEGVLALAGVEVRPAEIVEQWPRPVGSFRLPLAEVETALCPFLHHGAILRRGERAHVSSVSGEEVLARGARIAKGCFEERQSPVGIAARA
jgi:hypothetical protein